MNLLRAAWQQWKRIGLMIGNLIGRIVLSIFYFTIFVPFGLGVRLFGDPLAIRTAQQKHWLERSTSDGAVDDARRLG